MKFYFQLLVLFFVFNLKKAVLWNTDASEHASYVEDDFVSRSNLKAEPIVTAPLQNTHHVESNPLPADGTSTSGKDTPSEEKNWRQNINGRTNQYQTSNVSVEYLQENGTWKVEKQEKPLESSKEVMETQHATCKVTTEELVATAQATVTRVLKGLCNSREMENRFKNLETQMMNQLNIIKGMIVNVEDRVNSQGEALDRGQKQLVAAYSKNCAADSGDSVRSSKIVQEYVKPRQNDDQYDDVEEETAGVRDTEILKYNSSIHMESSMSGPPKKVFTYYWKITHMQYKLSAWGSSRSLRSQSFYIFPNGYRMYIRIFPRQNEENFSIHVGLTKGDYDDKLKWPFPLRHKVHILDQTKEGRMLEDITSRIWDPNQLCSEFNWQKPTKGDNYECVGLGFPHDVLRQREYIRNDACVVKLTVYLEP